MRWQRQCRRIGADSVFDIEFECVRRRRGIDWWQYYLGHVGNARIAQAFVDQRVRRNHHIGFS